MNTKRKWYELLLPGLAVLLVLAVGAVQTAKAGYYGENTGNYTNRSSNVDVNEPTYKKYSTTLATAYVQGTSCHASLVNYLWTKGTYESLSGFAESWVRKDWTWYEGGTPAGGTLTWSYSAEGKPYVAGHNDIPNPETQSAMSIAGADSDTYARLDSGVPAYVKADAWGYMIDDGAAVGDYDIDSDPEATITDSEKTEESESASSYVAFVEYEIDIEDEEEIIERGTNYFYVRCDTEVAATAYSSSSGGAESEVFITSTASADCDYTFVPNE